RLILILSGNVLRWLIFLGSGLVRPRRIFSLFRGLVSDPFGPDLAALHARSGSARLMAHLLIRRVHQGIVRRAAHAMQGVRGSWYQAIAVAGHPGEIYEAQVRAARERMEEVAAEESVATQTQGAKENPREAGRALGYLVVRGPRVARNELPTILVG